MDKQHRMANVFKMPVVVADIDDASLHGIDCNNEQFFIADTGWNVCDSELHAESAAQAINTHDAMQDRIAELEQELDQLKSQNASFSEAIQCAADIFKRLDEQGAHIIGEEDIFLNLRCLYENLLIINPAQCLAEHDAQLLEYWADGWLGGLGDQIRKEANNLRQQATPTDISTQVAEE